MPVSNQATEGRLTEDARFVTKRGGVRGGQPYFALAASGNFGGGTLTAEAGIEMSDGVLRFFAIPGVSLGADGYVVFACACDALAITLTGSSGADLLWAVR